MSDFQVQFGWMGEAPIDVRGTNRIAAGVVVGDVVVLDNSRLDAASTSNTVGLSTGGVGNFLAMVTENQPYAISGVILRSAADDIQTTARLRGPCDAVKMDATVVLSGATRSVVVGPVTTTVAAQVLAANAAALVSTLTASGGAVAGRPTKIIFIPLTARTGAGTTDGWFNGISGFGCALIVPN